MTLRYSLLCALAALLFGPLASAQSIVINEIHYNPASDASGDANGDGTSDFSQDEFIEIVNTSDAAIDISGYTLSDDDGGDFVFPSGTTLAAGQYAVLFGGGTPVGSFGGALVFTDDGSIGSGLSNSGDLIQLKDAGGTVVTEVPYGNASTTNSAGTADDESLARSPNATGAFVAHSSITSNPLLFSPGRSNTEDIGSATLTAILLGANEVPPVTTPAAGSVRAVLNGTELIVTGRFDDLQSDYNAAVGSHLHGGAAGENGPVRYALAPTLDADNRGGVFEASKNVITVRSTFADSLRNGLVYVNVHTVDNPSGEVRGQLRTTTPATELTLRQARIVGTGYTVTVTGTVSRAMGDFAYIESGTGGLTIRQTSGAFADEVEAGTIQPGTQVTLTGTLSEFNGLLQVNGSDLQTYSTAAGTVPTQSVVTLAQLIAGGEAFEGRLVEVRNVTFTESGTFATSKTYTVTDGTDTFAVRIGSADDTSIDGTAIPSGPARLLGVIDEFRGTYRIVPIMAGDVANFTVSTGDDPEGALALSIANPLRGSARVTFETGAAGPATLAVYDALGRRVALLADGETTGAAQTVALDADALAAGVYVVRLQAGDRVLTRTVTVVR